MDRNAKKFELLKGAYNTLLVAMLGCIGYLFVNFHSLDSTRIIIGSVGTVILAMIILLLIRSSLEE